MTEQQLQYLYWDRIRRNQLYKMYAVACGDGQPYNKIKRISNDWFLNYIEYNADKITPDKANARFLNSNDNISGGRCTGVHKGDKVLRQLDWYYNNEAEFIIKMNGSAKKGIYSSIGVTASSPKLTWQIVKDHIEHNRYNSYFELLPYMTVDGVNEKGIFAQSNVVEENGIYPININPEGKDCCCSIMLVRFILDHVGDINELDNFLKTLHLYSAPKQFISYNNHIMVADSKGNTKIIEFIYDAENQKYDYTLVDYPVMTNFRTNGFTTLGQGVNERANLSSVEENGIGTERWDLGIKFVNSDVEPTTDNLKTLRSKLNYTNAYNRTYDEGVQLSDVWLTDNLSSDEIHGQITVLDTEKYRNGTLDVNKTNFINDTLSAYRQMYNTATREIGNTWITTHSCIYDLTNLSCNIQSQEKKCWNVYFDGTITEDNVI